MYHMLLIKFTELDQQLAYRFDLKERIQVIFHNQTLCNKIVLGRSVECKFVTVHSINYRRIVLNA